jgi:hypothetical protein
MRYVVKNAQGEQLTVPSLEVLHELYTHGFLGDDDLVRSETSSRWIRAGKLSAFQGVRYRRKDPRKMWMLVAVAMAVAVVVALLLRP